MVPAEPAVTLVAGRPWTGRPLGSAGPASWGRLGPAGRAQEARSIAYATPS